MSCAACLNNENLPDGWVCDVCGDQSFRQRCCGRCFGALGNPRSFNMCSDGYVHTDGRRRICTLPSGHEGPHIACSDNTHDIDTWPQVTPCGAPLAHNAARITHRCARPAGHEGAHCSSTKVTDTARISWDACGSEAYGLRGEHGKCCLKRGHDGHHAWYGEGRSLLLWE